MADGQPSSSIACVSTYLTSGWRYLDDDVVVIRLSRTSRLWIGLGRDLSDHYVRINADYTT